ncbi:DUF3871 family protein [Gelidibacter salicanalis]|uniref:DUF3871 family protein n=1 Tax=Gelidibacter salicanalis TaxID=291193 RepID=A0A5C7ALX6_9FLAO|nr:DUF3871 family protein [Gelidibacter salicanalis]TXE08553.1 DUF3871 family protein [Gelidibacter salicanalis]
MELLQTQNRHSIIVPQEEIVVGTNKAFIEANTLEVSLSHLKTDCTIPVFSKDNECTISHQEFIGTAYDCAKSIFSDYAVSMPEVRVSHIVKGRIPSAIGKPVKELKEHEKTIYYERMMFKIEIPDVYEMINGNLVKLTLGGVRAYNQENLYSKKTFEKFKFFIGFQNMVCCNMCVTSDGYVGEMRVGSLEDLKKQILEAIGSYQMQYHLESMKALTKHKLSERQFAQLIGRCRLYNYLPKKEKVEILPFLLNDGQINNVARAYYEDDSFCREDNGDITLWNFFNLLTSSNKSSYIDTFLDRSLNAHEITQALSNSLNNRTSVWYLN